MLKDRLDTAYQLYLNGKVQKLLLSGDNSAEDYNEPQVMYDYLVFTLNMPPEDAVRDFAGLRTYDTCARAKNIWDIDKALLISQGYHLSRAIFTCNQLGIESTGYSATVYPYLGETYYKARELLAIHKAVLDVYILHPEYIGGKPEYDFRD
jgi:SanA protein